MFGFMDDQCLEVEKDLPLHIYTFLKTCNVFSFSLSL